MRPINDRVLNLGREINSFILQFHENIDQFKLKLNEERLKINTIQNERPSMVSPDVDSGLEEWVQRMAGEFSGIFPKYHKNTEKPENFWSIICT